MDHWLAAYGHAPGPSPESTRHDVSSGACQKQRVTSVPKYTYIDAIAASPVNTAMSHADPSPTPSPAVIGARQPTKKSPGSQCINTFFSVLNKSMHTKKRKKRTTESHSGAHQKYPSLHTSDETKRVATTPDRENNKEKQKGEKTYPFPHWSGGLSCCWFNVLRSLSTSSRWCFTSALSAATCSFPMISRFARINRKAGSSFVVSHFMARKISFALSSIEYSDATGAGRRNFETSVKYNVRPNVTPTATLKTTPLRSR
ncbi:hypothetical protein TCSYLVIO_000172 [Trypanosoma cruzi]|nr:hypothetical protein TCSYLVIO_000172 [Trypanosoma cruzi]